MEDMAAIAPAELVQCFFYSYVNQTLNFNNNNLCSNLKTGAIGGAGGQGGGRGGRGMWDLFMFFMPEPHSPLQLTMHYLCLKSFWFNF